MGKIELSMKDTTQKLITHVTQNANIIATKSQRHQEKQALLLMDFTK